LRAVIAIIGGFLSTLVLALGTDFLLMQILPGHEESSSFPLLIATLVYTQIYAAVGGYVTGRIARPRPMRAVSILAGIAFILSLAVLMMPGSTLPLWSKTASLMLLIPCTLAGGWLANRAQSRPLR